VSRRRVATTINGHDREKEYFPMSVWRDDHSPTQIEAYF
jgi:hypothetical protein